MPPNLQPNRQPAKPKRPTERHGRPKRQNEQPAVPPLKQARDLYRSLGNEAGMRRTLELLRRAET